jgi:hypothetical protein
VYNNTIIGQSVFAVFRLQYGSSGRSGSRSGNQQISISDNLVINTAATAIQYARNDGNVGSFRFGPQVWAGIFTQFNFAGLPSFPQSFDIRASRFDAGRFVQNPDYTGLTGLEDATARYTLTADSPARGRGSAGTAAPTDIVDRVRPLAAPSIGASEYGG